MTLFALFKFLNWVGFSLCTKSSVKFLGGPVKFREISVVSRRLQWMSGSCNTVLMCVHAEHSE